MLTQRRHRFARPTSTAVQAVALESRVHAVLGERPHYGGERPLRRPANRVVEDSPTWVTAVRLPDLTTREAWVVAPLIAVIIALGFVPQPLLKVINPAVGTTLEQVGVIDPAPVVPAAEGARGGEGR